MWALVTTAFYTGSCVGYAVISTPRHYKRYLSVSDPYFIVELAASFFCALEIAFHIIVKGPVRELLSNTWVITSLVTIAPLLLHVVCLQLPWSDLGKRL